MHLTLASFRSGGRVLVCGNGGSAADGSTIVMAINFEPRSLTCPVKVNCSIGRVWRGVVKADAIDLAPNEVALFEVK